MPQEHKIETFTDIVNAVTADNIDSFMIDFKHALETILDLKKLAGDDDIMPYINPFFIWVDDGKHNIDIKIIE